MTLHHCFFILTITRSQCTNAFHRATIKSSHKHATTATFRLFAFRTLNCSVVDLWMILEYQTFRSQFCAAPWLRFVVKGWKFLSHLSLHCGLEWALVWLPSFSSESHWHWLICVLYLYHPLLIWTDLNSFCLGRLLQVAAWAFRLQWRFVSNKSCWAPQNDSGDAAEIKCAIV